MPEKSKIFEASTKKIHRLIAILRILDNRERCTRESLAKKFSVSIRTIDRDINVLNSAGFLIVFVKEDGSVVFKVTLEGTEELKWWIYHWIPQVEILSLSELREEMVEDMRAMLALHENK